MVKGWASPCRRVGDSLWRPGDRKRGIGAPSGQSYRAAHTAPFILSIASGTVRRAARAPGEQSVGRGWGHALHLNGISHCRDSPAQPCTNCSRTHCPPARLTLLWNLPTLPPGPLGQKAPGIPSAQRKEVLFLCPPGPNLWPVLQVSQVLRGLVNHSSTEVRSPSSAPCSAH